MTGGGIYMFYIHNPLKHFLTGKCLYIYEHIPTYGDIPSKHEWHMTDIDALNSPTASWADFIKRVYPDEKILKPKN